MKHIRNGSIALLALALPAFGASPAKKAKTKSAATDKGAVITASSGSGREAAVAPDLTTATGSGKSTTSNTGSDYNTDFGCVQATLSF